MGKYRQWLHHQEVGRRLREQIAAYEQERERVQRMAPSHPTTLPDTNNPLIRALLDYTGRGGTLGKAEGPRITVGGITTSADAPSQQRQPAERPAQVAQPKQEETSVLAGSPAEGMTPTAPLSGPSASVLAQLTQRAAAIPENPLEAMQALTKSQQNQSTAEQPAPQQPASASEQAAPTGDTPAEWWKQYRSQQ